MRYLIRGVRIYGYHENIPLGTLLINVSGAFVMACVLTVAFEVWSFDSDVRLGVTTGFLGAFTTFSALCKETVGLIQNGDYFSAISYMTVSVVLGLGAAYFGAVVAREIGSRILRKKEKADGSMENESEAD